MQVDSVLIVQETHLTNDGQKSADLMVNELGCDACWSAPTKLSRSKDGTLRVGWGPCPGVVAS